jgi:hypothetical protein
LREEIAGVAMAQPKAFEILDDKISSNPASTVTAWVSVLRALLPTMALNLPKNAQDNSPIEAYEVVRSTEHTQTVIRNTKGIVAGTETALVPSFNDLRALLWLPGRVTAVDAVKA